MKSMSMISSAIQSSLVMIPIILIIHLLLKHFLLDKVNSDPRQIEKSKATKKKKNCDHEESIEDYECEGKEREGEKEKSVNGNKLNSGSGKAIGTHEENTFDDEETYLKRRLHMLRENKEKNENNAKQNHAPNYASQPVKIQNRRPVLDPSTTKVTPSSEDVYSFVLEGEPSLGKKSFEDNSVETKANSFFTDPHTPQSVSDQQKFFKDEKLFSAERDDDSYMKPEPRNKEKDNEKMLSHEYSDPMFTKQGVGSADLFNNIDAANFDEGQSSLDEVFRQTQVPT